MFQITLIMTENELFDSQSNTVEETQSTLNNSSINLKKDFVIGNVSTDPLK